MLIVNINGKDCDVDVPEDMPLLWVLRDVLGLTGTKFGCGIAQCGVCTVHVDGQPIQLSFPKGITDIDTPEDYRKLRLAMLPQDLQGTSSVG